MYLTLQYVLQRLNVVEKCFESTNTKIPLFVRGGGGHLLTSLSFRVCYPSPLEFCVYVTGYVTCVSAGDSRAAPTAAEAGRNVICPVIAAALRRVITQRW